MMRARLKWVPSCFMGLLGLLAVGIGVQALFLPAIHHAIPRTFPHTPHTGVTCAVCHHDFGQERFSHWPHKQCVACHVLTPDISAATETTFHKFCESCHITTLKAGLKSGPVKNCAGCHYTHVPHSKGTFILK